MNLLSDYMVSGIAADGVKVVKRDTGEEQTLEAETIVLAMGAKPERTLASDLEKAEVEFHSIGDCRQPNNIRQAIYEGALIGRQI